MNIVPFQINNTELNKDQLKSRLHSRILEVLCYLLPKGEISNGRFFVGNVKGDKGESLVVEISGTNIGLWKDFATDEGGDIFSLWGATHGCDTLSEFPKILDSVREWLGLPKVEINTLLKKVDPQHIFDSMTGKWDYTDENGNIIARVLRYDTPEGKQYRPWDVERHCYGTPNPRPLYNQQKMKHAEQVIIVEGEKCADILIGLGLCATTAMQGANAPIHKTDWSPLLGKHIIIWADNDVPGKKYADAVLNHLSTLKIASLGMVKIPLDKPAKWDVADAVAEGMDVKELLLHTEKKSLSGFNTINPALWKGAPPKREWLIKEWLPRGYVTALYGDGGIGKSLLAQQLMTSIATGQAWLGHEVTQGRVFGLMCEDDENELWRRQVSINQAHNVNMEALNNIRLISRIGHENLLMTFDGKDEGTLSRFFHCLQKEVMDFKADLIVLDTAADLFGGNEINRTHVRQFIQNACGRIARSINGAVLLCAHPSNHGMQNKTGVGGSTAWNNTVRSRWYLTRDEEQSITDLRILSRKKSNYSAIGDDLHLIWNKGALVKYEVDLTTTRVSNQLHGSNRDAERNRQYDKILQIIFEEGKKGKLYTSNQFCRAFENKADLGSTYSIRNRIDVLSTTGYIKYHKDKVAKTKFGLLCVEGMKVPSEEKTINMETHEEVIIYKKLLPTHQVSLSTGEAIPVTDPLLWEYSEEDIV